MPQSGNTTLGDGPQAPVEETAKEAHNIGVSTNDPIHKEVNDDEKPTAKETQVDGGLVAWLQVLGGFCLFFTSW